MLTSTPLKDNWCLKWLSFPAIVVLLCYTRGICCMDINQACTNGTTLVMTYRNNTPFVFKRTNEMEGILVDVLEKGIQVCCKAGAQIHYNPLRQGVTNQTFQHGFIPLSRTAYATTAFGEAFIGLIDTPSIAVITQRNVPGADLLMAILDSWPILIFIIISISLSGVVVWFLDHKKNPKHFPAYFPVGVFEGFWWAAVTMTTVGYGDRVPKSVWGRLFAVLWINAGLVILAMFMGIVTASLTTSSLGLVDHLWGLQIAAINGSAEYQFAVIQSADVQAQENYEDMYSSIASGKAKIALVDLYTATWHKEYLSRHKLSIATTIEQRVVYGVVLPYQSTTLQQCLRDYSQSYQLQSYSYIAKYSTHVQKSEVSDGTEYFRGSMFGYSVYAMTGIFIVILGTGLWWQYYWQPRRGEWKQGNDTAVMKELELTTMNVHGYPRANYTTHALTTTAENLRPHCSRTQQCVGIRQLLDEYREYENSWIKRFTYLQEKHRREQIEVISLDHDEYGS